MKEFTTEQKNLDRAIIMQILRFEFSDLPDCSGRKRHILLRVVWNCGAITNHSEHDYKCIAVINK